LFEHWNRWLGSHARLAGGLLFLSTYIVFCGTLSNLFVHDDIPQVLDNPFLRNTKDWMRIFTGSVWSFRGPAQHDNMYRPLQFFTYWMLYRLRGPNPAIFHLFMLLFYTASVWLVFCLARRLFTSALVAFGGALLWALHPLHVESVAWISALPDLGAAFFYVLGFLLFIRAEQSPEREIRGHLLAAAGFFPALFFKEMALSFPLMVLAYWYFFPGKQAWKTRLAHWTIYVSTVAIYSAIRVAVLGRFSEAPHLLQTSWRMLVAAFALLGQDARLFFWPAQLSIFRSFNLAASLRPPWPELALLILAAALFLRRRQPTLGFLLAWWLVGLLPCLDVRQVSSAVADRYSLLPSVGLCLVLAYAAFACLPDRLRGPQSALAVTFGFAVMVALWVVQDVRTVRHWHDNVSLWDQAYAASPDSPVAHMLRGALLQQRDGRLDAAAREYRIALKLNQTSERPLPGITAECSVLLGQVANTQGRTRDAIDNYQQALRAVPGYSLAYKALGILYFPQGEYSQSKSYFQRAVELNPHEEESRFYLGTCELKLGEPREAAMQFHAAHEIDSTYVEAYEAEARALEAAGEKMEAARVRESVPRRPAG
jgi:Tfp pilus assembly protein PilF